MSPLTDAEREELEWAVSVLKNYDHTDGWGLDYSRALTIVLVYANRHLEDWP